MIGYYVHHHGNGHLHRALAVAGSLEEPVTILSSLPPPAAWTGEWVHLARDDTASDRSPQDPTAHGRLHWVPVGDDGLSRRMHQASTWLEQNRPRLLVADVSVEVALLARLHGVPVVGVVLPGRRDDPAHRLGFDVADTLVGWWPPTATPSMLPGLPDVASRVHAVGALSRWPVKPPPVRRPGPGRVVFLGGTGGCRITEDALDAIVDSTPSWQWTVCGPPGSWVDDPEASVRDADVVVTHAGQNAVAEVAAARRPAVLLPQPRPHDEQLVSSAALEAGGLPVRVETAVPSAGWQERLERTAALDGDRWQAWCDGRAADRFASVLSR